MLRIAGAFLAEPDRHHWGYDLCRQTGVRSGVLYPVLSRFERRGWLRSDWETELVPGRPRRRYYEMTDQGRHDLPLFVSDEMGSVERRIFSDPVAMAAIDEGLAQAARGEFSPRDW